MKYWPLTEIAVHLHHTQVWDIMCTFHKMPMPERTMIACNQVAAQLAPSVTSLVLIESLDAPLRRMYTSRPEIADWLRLERSGFIATENYFGFVIDALH